jgi:hypothetical protein
VSLLGRPAAPGENRRISKKGTNISDFSNKYKYLEDMDRTGIAIQYSTHAEWLDLGT